MSFREIKIIPLSKRINSDSVISVTLINLVDLGTKMKKSTNVVLTFILMVTNLTNHL